MDKEQEEALAVVRQQVRDLRELVRSQGWAQLLNHAKEQIRSRTDAVMLTPLEDSTRLTEQEFKKGEVAGIRLFTEMPNTLVEAGQAAIKQLTGEDSEEPDEELDLVQPELFRR